MGKINDRIQWREEVYQIARGDKVEGGMGGTANRQAQQLADRTLYLKALIESFKDYTEKTFYITEGDPDGTITGRENTASGEVFRVAQGGNADNAFIYYLNDNGTAVVIARVNAMNRVKPTDNNAFLFRADNGIVAAIMPDGTLRAIAVKADELIAPFLETENISSKKISVSGGNIREGKHPFSLSADNGDILVVDGTGKMYGIECDFSKISLGGVDIRELFGEAKPQEVKIFKMGMISGYIHFAFYGQSQVIATTNGTIHTSSFDPDSLMLYGGLKSFGTPGYNTSVPEAEYNKALRPMYEVNGESYCSGMAIAARQYINDKYPNRDVKNIYTVNGAGGATLDMLKKGTASYNRMVQQTVALISLLREMGEAYHCPSMGWSQGGSDDGQATDPDVYQNGVDALRENYNADILARTGVKIDPAWIINQINNYMRYPALNGKPNIGLRQYKMVTDSSSKYYAASPTYICDFIDVAHWTKESQVKVGAYFEKTRRALLEKGDWKPVHPVLITTSGMMSNAMFHLPEGAPLQFNVEYVNAATNYGFSAAQADGTPIGIDRVRLVSDDTVEIRYTEQPLPGAVLMYGQTGQTGDPNAANGSGLGRTNGMRGNLCDTAGNNEKIYVSASEPEYPLHNWCWMFTESMGV
ncbi:hypothetical protein [Klebsiella pneumoniae]|uniref:hypothetical protein n=1 Tax=Klebsiella pneumoniae TaxID=573 RepID=UPI0038D06194